MALRPVYGHDALRARLATALHADRLPASLLFVGRRGIGKQRLALWLAQLLVCDRATTEGLSEPCGTCQHCRYAERGTHPDVHWFFPHPRLKDGDPAPDDVVAELGDTIADRMKADGLWSPSSGSEGIYVSTVRALIHQSSSRPAMATRTVFVVGDADRMVSQEGADQAANAFLKLLEEPPRGTVIVLTSSEPGALLPTIRSRVVTVRMRPLLAGAMEEFSRDQAVQRHFARHPLGDAVDRAHGAPGALLAGDTTAASLKAARLVLEAALAPDNPEGQGTRVKAAARQGVSGARGTFSDMLEALTVLLHDRTRTLVRSGSEQAARHAAQALMHVEFAKEKAQGNVSPQLLTVQLLDRLQRSLHSGAS